MRFVTTGLVLLFSTFLFSAEVDRNLPHYINFYPQKVVKVWIIFTDKGDDNRASLHKAEGLVSERALKRRAKVIKDNLIDIYDFPVNEDYLTQVKSHVLKVRNQSRWLNAVCAEIKTSDIDKVALFPFVKEIRLLSTYKKRVEEPVEELMFQPIRLQKTHTLDYGSSFGQLDQINVPALHEKGLSGNGVIIGMLDDGYNLYKTHTAFDSLKVLGTWDFINNDSTVDDPGATVNRGKHGTVTLSVIGSNAPGVLIGPAYGASYFLAKTEVDPGESQVEEDNWVAGLEWAEANGADIISSSVGYGYYASGNPPESEWWYDWQDMDGRTAVTTKATIIAEAKGLIVVNSAGNERYNAEHNTLSAPADGEFVITVGSVSSSGIRASSSSVGPTADGRIKPDVMARGISVVQASSSNNSSFGTFLTGTSFSAPLVAGSIALLLEAFPHLTPHDVRTAIKNTASKAQNLDNLMGYGVLDIYGAYNFILDTTYIPGEASVPDGFVLEQNFPNPFNGITHINYAVKNASFVKTRIFDVAGREVFVFPKMIVISKESQAVSASLFGASGVYFYQAEFKEIVSGKVQTKMRKMIYLK